MSNNTKFDLNNAKQQAGSKSTEAINLAAGNASNEFDRRIALVADDENMSPAQKIFVLENVASRLSSLGLSAFNGNGQAPQQDSPVAALGPAGPGAQNDPRATAEEIRRLTLIVEGQNQLLSGILSASPLGNVPLNTQTDRNRVVTELEAVFKKARDAGAPAPASAPADGIPKSEVSTKLKGMISEMEDVTGSELELWHPFMMPGDKKTERNKAFKKFWTKFLAYAENPS